MFKVILCSEEHKGFIGKTYDWADHVDIFRILQQAVPNITATWTCAGSGDESATNELGPLTGVWIGIAEDERCKQIVQGVGDGLAHKWILC